MAPQDKACEFFDGRSDELRRMLMPYLIWIREVRCLVFWEGENPT
jgi:hypothetical protein